ncbi:recombinase family protein [Paraoerskovia sediminicola]|nr:recombinase family protein [Paraoerskovia sediminicola]
MAIIWAYARVSTAGQVLDAQLDALRGAGVDERHIEVEKASGLRHDRPVLDQLLARVATGDTVVVTKLDRLGRSVPHLLRVVGELEQRGVTLRSLSEAIDTSSAGGRFMVTMIAALAEMEADLIRERTVAGLAAARSRGRIGGRPLALSSEAVRAGRAAHLQGESVAAIARSLKVSPSTVRRHVIGHGEKRD